MKFKKTCSFLLALLVLGPGTFITSTVAAQETPPSDRPRLGVRVAAIHDQVQIQGEIDVSNGVLVTHVLPDSPAQRAGVQQFDVIQALNETTISSVRKLRQHMRSRSIGKSIQLTIRRDGETRTLRIELPTSGSGEAVSESESISDQKKMDRVLKKMNDVEKHPRIAREETGSSSRSPEQLRRKMKSFLQDHPPTRTSNQLDKNNENGEATHESDLSQWMKQLRNRLQKAVGDRLNAEQLDKIVEEFRSLAKRMSKTDIRTRLKDMLEQMQDTLKRMDGKTGQKLSEWESKIEKRISKQMSTFKEQLDRKMQTFEKRMEQQMREYSDKLQEKVEELNRLTKELRTLKQNKKESTDRGQEEISEQPYLGIRPAMDPAGEGILIREVKPDSPADRAGLKKGDVIRKMNGNSIEGVQNLQKRLYQNEPGEKVKLFVERDGWTRTLTVKLGRKNSSGKDPSSSESQSGANDSTLQERLFSLRGDQRNVLRRGKRAMWMLDLYTHYQNGDYLQVLKKGLQRGMDKLKQKLQDTPLQLKGKFTLQNAENGSVLFSVPLDQNLADAVQQVDRVLTVLMGN